MKPFLGLFPRQAYELHLLSLEFKVRKVEKDEC